MKQIFTLLTAGILLANNANSQISETFETTTDFQRLQDECWTFSNANFSSDPDTINGTGSIISTFDMTTEIQTPFLNIPNDNLELEFNFDLIYEENGGSKSFKIFLERLDGTRTILENNINLNGSSYKELITNANSPGNTISGIQKIVLQFNGRITVLVDDFITNASYAYAGGCAPVTIPLPVRLTSFTGSIVNKKAQIKWSVDDNETGSHFNLQRSTDGRNFTSAATVMNTSKAGLESYTYTDNMDLNGTVYYRLMMTNRDGSSKYSNIIMLKAGEVASNELTLMQNPVSNTLNFTYNTPKTGTYTVTIYNAAGLKLFASKINCQPGVNSVSLPIDAKMAKGVYIMEVSGNTERAVKQILKN